MVNSEIDPESVKCPACGARIGEACSGYSTHARRFEAAGIPREVPMTMTERRAQLAAEHAQIPEPVRSVYFVQTGTNGPIKIGKTVNFPRRFKTLQTTSAGKLVVRGIIAGASPTLEGELHLRFAEHRLHGEWFAPAEELLAFIKDRASASIPSWASG